MADRRMEAAVQGFARLPPTLEHALASDVHAWSVQACLGLINEAQWGKALPLLERAVRSRPDEAGAVYALARARGEAGDHGQALKLYEQAAVAKGAGAWPVQYRLGLTLEQLGRLEEAKAAFKRHVAAGKGPKNLLEEARKRLACSPWSPGCRFHGPDRQPSPTPAEFEASPLNGDGRATDRPACPLAGAHQKRSSSRR